MNLQRHKERAEAVRRFTDGVFICEDSEGLADQLAHLADVVADLCDDLTRAEPTVLRRGCWLHDAPTSLWFFLVEQIDHSEQWWAVRFDRYGCASTGLKNIHVADYQRCEAPGWWV